MAPEIFAPVVGTVQEFINWSLTIVSLMIIWYVIKFFMVAPPTEEQKQQSKDEYEQRGAKMREWFSGKMKDREEKEKFAANEQKKKSKKQKVSPAKKSLIDAIENADETLNLIGKARTSEDRKELVKLFNKFNDNMQKTWGNLRLHRKNLEGEERKKLKELADQSEAIIEFVNNNLKKKLPKMSSDFLQKVQSTGITANIKKVRGMCHDLWDKLEELHN